MSDQAQPITVEAIEFALRRAERDMACVTAWRRESIASIRAAKRLIRATPDSPVVNRQERTIILRLWRNRRYFDAKMDDASRRYEQALKAEPTEVEQVTEQRAQGELF